MPIGLGGMRGTKGRKRVPDLIAPQHQEVAMHVWRDIGVELSLGLAVLFMVGAMLVTFFLSR